MSRDTWCRAEYERDGAVNDATLCLPAAGLLPVPRGGPPSTPTDDGFAELFRLHHETIRSLLEGRRQAGLAALVVTGARLEARAWFDARATDIHSLVIGRHDACDLFLPEDEALSLRHVLLVLHPHGPEASSPRYRVYDLRTPRGLRDEDGRPIQAVESQGPLLLRFARYSLLLFPTAAGCDWPRDVDAAWRRVPERVYVNAVEAPASRPGRRASAGEERGRQERTLAETFPGPRLAPFSPDPSDHATGELRVENAAGSLALGVGPRAARRGILLGRYDRCDGGPGQPLRDTRHSRVHALVVEIDGELHAIDTCSRNGTWEGPRRVRSQRLRPGVTLTLAGETRLDWRPFH